MSKSLDNYVALTEPPDDMFGKLMRIPDGLITKYLRLTLSLEPGDLDGIERGLTDGSVHPNDAKRRLAREVVDRYHGPGAGVAAEGRFNRVHRERELPDEIPEVPVPAGIVRAESGAAVIYVPALLKALGLVKGTSEARRLQAQGGVRMDGEPISDEELRIEGDPAALSGTVWQVGRRRFARVGTVSA
jgi:tyrosyl-tRNA synthetase